MLNERGLSYSCSVMLFCFLPFKKKKFMVLTMPTVVFRNGGIPPKFASVFLFLEMSLRENVLRTHYRLHSYLNA